MRITRREFVACVASAALAGCSSQPQGGEPSQESDGYHRVVVEDVSFEVPDSYDFDDSRERKDSYSHEYTLAEDGTSRLVDVSTFSKEHEVAGSYEVVDVGGTTVYYDPKTCVIKFNHGGRGYTIIVADPNLESSDVFGHLLDTLRFD